MRRITAAIGVLALTAGVFLGLTGTASAQAESVPPLAACVGSSLLMFNTTALCVVDRHYPVIIWG
ncbi:hypothetical protein AB0M80_38830 [Amycolatopsis sp. NPDC051045]|uniref:hypothetical protein n=1 Tax=Amycolatopsis sp. NPDC051045 TaxID=3156922 RepID=UPI003439DC0F